MTQRSTSTLPSGAPPPDATRLRRGMLIVLHGPDAGVMHPVVDELVLGRSESASVYVDDEKVSRRHARLVAVGPEQVRLEDLGSKNGTWLNGQRLLDSAILADGDNIQIGERAAFHFVLRDTLERRVIERQKMEAIGRLAGRTAHAFNNLLSVALGGLSQLRDMSSTLPPLQRDIINDSIEAIERATELSLQLLGLARRPVPVSEPIALNAFIGDLGRVFQRTLGPGQALVLEVDPDLFVLGDRSQLQQALLNVCINAREATPSGGTIKVRASRRRIVRQDEVARVEGVVPGDYVEIVVRDSGEGIDPVHLKHIFEPFFTTKKSGQASGLGLAIVLAVVHGHGGAVSVRSAPGQGTEMSLFFPVAPAKVDAGPATIRGVPLALEHHTVLVVDDDAAVLRSVTRMLEHLGQRVLATTTAEGALSIFRAKGPSIDVIILDIAMPGRDGLALLADLRQLDPKIRVILSSGSYGEVKDTSGVIAFLPKPYTLQQISEALKAVR